MYCHKVVLSLIDVKKEEIMFMLQLIKCINYQNVAEDLVYFEGISLICDTCTHMWHARAAMGYI